MDWQSFHLPHRLTEPLVVALAETGLDIHDIRWLLFASGDRLVSVKAERSWM